MFQCSEGLKAALDEYAGKRNLGRAAVIRQAIATQIKYDLSKEPARTRATKYADPEARKAAQKRRNAEKREWVKTLIEAARRAEREDDIKHLEASIA